VLWSQCRRGEVAGVWRFYLLLLHFFFQSCDLYGKIKKKKKKKSCTNYKCLGLVTRSPVTWTVRWTNTFNKCCYLLALLRRQFPDSVKGSQSMVVFYVDINS
jgi:uncharacterized membrane protein